MHSPRPRHRRIGTLTRRGFIMPITLVALVLLLVAVAAMLKSADTSSVVVGNMAFRRDLTNRAEAAVVAAKAALVSGDLKTEAARDVNTLTANVNYSATQLQLAPNGVPAVLLSNSGYDAAYPLHTATTSSDGVTLRWVIDRQCLNTGVYDAGSCENVALNSSSTTGGTNWLRKPTDSSRPVYRISVRVSGPRNSEAYFQTSYAD